MKVQTQCNNHYGKKHQCKNILGKGGKLSGMEILKIVLSVFEAIGTIATAITLIIALMKFRKKLKIKGGVPLKKPDAYLLSIYNNTLYDSEIESVCLFKGNPKFNGIPLNTVSFDNLKLQINPANKNIVIDKSTRIDLPISLGCIIGSYDIVRETVGKVFDDIYILIKDNKGNHYIHNTEMNIDYFRKLINQGMKRN